ncbi:hypothetical protein R1flu_028926 [Riccia fluitans]|uniref:Uncharacterized protein n=1 Tax=Riccia fluitans TaxID=41844 RepID=A0ABD1XNQ8_9MARC
MGMVHGPICQGLKLGGVEPTTVLGLGTKDVVVGWRIPDGDSPPARRFSDRLVGLLCAGGVGKRFDMDLMLFNPPSPALDDASCSGYVGVPVASVLPPTFIPSNAWATMPNGSILLSCNATWTNLHVYSRGELGVVTRPSSNSSKDASIVGSSDSSAFDKLSISLLSLTLWALLYTPGRASLELVARLRPTRVKDG